MNTDQHSKQFRVNPVEIVILLLVSGLFGNSMVQLFSGQVSPSSLSKELESTGRAPASTQSSLFAHIEIPCGDTKVPTTTTKAPRVRISGLFCGQAAQVKSFEPKIQNSTKKVSATVFVNSERSKYFTDYLPLDPGLNQIKVSLPGAVSGGFTEIVVEVNRS